MEEKCLQRYLRCLIILLSVQLIVDNNEVANFFVPKQANGVSIEETWDSIAMRGTGSHDLVLNDVILTEKYCVEKLTTKKKQMVPFYIFRLVI